MVKAVRERFFDEFAASHRKWLRELVSKYKASGIIPVLPTQIIEYYADPKDKEIAIFTALAMNWYNGRELEQIKAIRKLIGEHPWQWFADREFILISVGREQDHHVDGYREGRYWKIAKIFDLLWDECFDGFDVRLPSQVLRGRTFYAFIEHVKSVCQITKMEYKRDVMRIVLFTTDGIGRALWGNHPNWVHCPESSEIKQYLAVWFPFWRTGLWTWQEAVRLFRLDHDYDFYYAWLAHSELESLDPKACKHYATCWQYRWDKFITYPGRKWLGTERRAPIINFEQQQ